MIDWQTLARLFAESETKAELEFSIVELLKDSVDEKYFWEKVEDYRIGDLYND